MKRFALLWLLLWLFPVAALASRKIEKESFTSQNKKRTFYLFVPETIKPDKPAPLIVLLHGSGHNGLSLVEKWKDLAEKEGFIIAGPDSTDPSHWSITTDGPSMLRDLVETLKSKYPINARRVYLFGHSAGAVFALDISLIESEYFAAAAIHAGSWREKDEFEMINSARRKIPLAIWVGTKDPYFPLESVRATRDALRARGFPIEVTEMAGHDHWYYDLAPRINEAAWQFLRQFELPAEQHYEEYVEVKDAAGVNKLIGEINALQTKVNELVAQANLKELELNARNFTRDGDEIKKLALEEANLLKEAAANSRDAADKADQAGKLKLSDRYRDYLKLIAQTDKKHAEVLEAKREQAEALLGAESFDVIRARRNEAQKKIEKLQEEANELRKQAERMRP